MLIQLNHNKRNKALQYFRLASNGIHPIMSVNDCTYSHKV